MDKVEVSLTDKTIALLKLHGTPEALARAVIENWVDNGCPSIETRKTAVKGAVVPEGGDRRFRVPVGDVLCRDTSPYAQIWWCPPDKITHIMDLAKPFTEDGAFGFFTGVDGGGTWYMPETIEEKDQERRRGGRFCVSCDMIPAYVGDRMVWLEILDPIKAERVLNKTTAIPCAVRCDAVRYSTDKLYARAFDLANEAFIYYCVNGKTKQLKTDTATLEEIFDL